MLCERGRHRRPGRAAVNDGRLPRARFGLGAQALARTTPRSAFDERMLKACSIEQLAEVRKKVRRGAGEAQSLGIPAVSDRDGYAVVDIPVALERAVAR